MIQITDNIYIGTTTEALNPELMDARHLKFKAILSCTTVVPPAVQGLPGVLYGRIDVPDATPWSAEQIQHAAGFIEAGVQRGKIFVHSDLGISRCVAAVCFYLTKKGESEDKAMAMIKEQYAEARPHQAILTGFTPAVKVTGKMPKPKAEIALSVVVVTWNRPEQAKACIGSVIERTAIPYELLVVDNGSREETLEVLRSFKGITLIELGRNFGKGAAANLGFRKSSGAYICYLDGDIEVPEGWFEVMQTAYEKLKKPGWITLPYEDTYFREGSHPEGLYEAASVEGGMVFMSREVYKEIGGFADNRLYGQIDTEYCAKARSRGLSVGYIDADPEIVHLGKEDSPHYRDLKRLGVPVLLKFPMIPDAVDIVMVRYNLPDAEQECIDSVLEQTEWPYRLTTVDNYRRKERLTVLWNELIGESKCSQVCLLNSDCVVSKGWLTRLAATFMLDDKIAAVGPSTNMAASDQRIIESLNPAKIPSFARETGKKFSEQWEPCDITGFCYLLKKDVWQQLGGFSPVFNLYGQEAEFNFRLTEKGYLAVWRKDAFVYHLGGASAQKASEKGEIDLEEEKRHASRTYAKLSTP